MFKHIGKLVEGRWRLNANVTGPAFMGDTRDGAICWHQGNTYALVESDEGKFSLGGTRVSIVSINGLGEIRWHVSDWTGALGMPDKATIESWGLTSEEGENALSS